MSDKIGRNARAFFCLIIYAHIWVTFWMYSRWPFATVPIIDEGYYKFDILPSNALNWTSTNFTCEESYTISCWEQWGMRASSGISFAAMNQFGYIGYICLITISSMLVFYVFVVSSRFALSLLPVLVVSYLNYSHCTVAICESLGHANTRRKQL